ncbi:MAG: hypothetical protein ACTSYS_06215 [Promethearchaeota archaeon]
MIISYSKKSINDYLKNLTISNIPEYFINKNDDGDSKSGYFSFSTANLDENYGEIAKIKISWAETNPIRYHVGKENVSLMGEFINMGVGFSEKKLIKINDHDAFLAIGAKKEAKRKGFYLTNYMVANFCCPVTKRKFTIESNVYGERFIKIKEHLINMIEGIICH